MSFQEHLAAEISLVQAEIDALAIQLKKLKRKHRELSRFYSDLVNSPEPEKESDNGEV